MGDSAEEQTQPARIMTGNCRDKLLTSLKWTLCAIVILLIARHATVHWNAAVQVRTFHPLWLAFGSLLAFSSFILSAWVVRMLLAIHGHAIPLHRVVGLVFIPMLGKYVPGKVWSIIGAFWYFRREGVPKRIAAACAGLPMLLGLIGAGVVVVVGASWGIHLVSPWQATAITLAALTVVHPAVFYPSMNWILARGGREPITVLLSFADLLRLLLVKIAEWLFYGAGFFCVARSIADIPAGELPRLIVLFACSQVVGFLALFAPAGIGVREGVLLFGLTPLAGEGSAIVIVGLVRLWQTALDLLMAGIGWWALRRPGVPAVMPGEETTTDLAVRS